ncbi:hypothetical protein [Rubritalea sp.]|uniref:hypothetical protein n=1 Tax=Rubritalea sp. TaxID=2109375 RepID=UPI003EF3B670
MKKILVPLNILAGLALVRFTVSKFAAWPISVAAFEDMAKPIGLDPTFFRISTGFVIGFASLSFFINAVLLLTNKIQTPPYRNLFCTNILYATGAMSGALLAEFFLRSHAAWPLVYIAISILIITAMNAIASLRKCGC